MEIRKLAELRLLSGSEYGGDSKMLLTVGILGIRKRASGHFLKRGNRISRLRWKNMPQNSSRGGQRWIQEVGQRRKETGLSCDLNTVAGQHRIANGDKNIASV
ncbi:MAG: hypothetical protein CL912_27065 [Deltaproteobacteria bacterium]|nr:hypothetical protein [Deltaproteobacteria bacterium]